MTDKMFSAISRLGLLLALLLVAWTASRLTWQILEPRPELPAQPQPTGAQATQQQVDFAQTILQTHLFGKPDRVVQAVKQAPVSRINLRLFGVLSTGDEAGLAMIGRNQRSLKLYRVGDRLPGAARLLEIHADHVLIKSNGREEMLLLKPDKGLIKVTPAKENASPAAGDDLSQLRARILDQPDRIEDFMSLQPVERNGSLIGYAISPRRSSAALFRKLGLRTGDVVTVLNGVALNSADASMEALLQLGDAAELSMVVERNGRRLNIRGTFD